MEPVVVGVIVVVVVAALLWALDRLTAAGVFDRRRPVEREPRPGGGGGGEAAFGALIDVFQPMHQHTTLERERQRLDIRQSPADAPPLIDLDSGVVVLPPADGAASGADDADDAPAVDDDALRPHPDPVQPSADDLPGPRPGA